MQFIVRNRINHRFVEFVLFIFFLLNTIFILITIITDEKDKGEVTEGTTILGGGGIGRHNPIR